jgi:hypothetical protein
VDSRTPITRTTSSGFELRLVALSAPSSATPVAAKISANEAPASKSAGDWKPLGDVVSAMLAKLAPQTNDQIEHTNRLATATRR